MAISPLSYNKTDIRVAIAGQTTFGTANTTQNQFYELHVTDIVTLDASGAMLSDDTKRSDGSRVRTITDVFRSEAGGENTIQVSGIATWETLSMLIFATMQDIVTEAVGDPFLKTFEWDEATTMLATGMPAYMLTVLLQDPVAAENKQLHTCVCKSLQITSDPGANAGRVSFTATLYTGFPSSRSSVTATPSSWNAPGSNFFLHQLLTTKTVAAADVVCGKFDLTLTNEATRHGYDGTGLPQYYAFGQPSVTGSIDIKYDANTVDLPDFWYASPHAASGDFQIFLQYGTDSAAGEFSIDVNAVYTGNPHERSDMGGALYMTVPFEGLSVVGGAEAIEILIADKKDRTWT